jgi:transposase
MFVREKANKSGKISVQVIDKSTGKYKVVYTAGCSFDRSEISKLHLKAKNWIKESQGIQEIDFSGTREQLFNFLDSIESLNRVGYDLVFGKVFDEIGFNKIEDEIFRELVMARIAFPKSKLKTIEYLYRYKQISWDEDQVYRYLDKLYNTQKEIVQQISFEHTCKILNQDISVVFYDVTTIYFEIDDEDNIGKTGFSKEGKHQNPQIILGLLVSRNGYPLAYEIFEGNKFEGHTMLPVVNAFKEKYQLGHLVIIADSGLLSRSNIEELQDKNYEFILGARIKNEPEIIMSKILGLELKNGQSAIVKKGELTLVITYSDSRAKKDGYNREKGIRKLEKLIRTGRLNKSNINNRGYNKFLKLEGEISVEIDRRKLENDKKWDGLKGYLTNAKMDKDQIIENYQHLWQIEKAFRVSKSDLKIRPIYHRIQKRIEAHICINFVAYKVFKEIERQLQEKKAKISVNKAIEIAENINEITVLDPTNKQKIKRTLLLTEEQKYLAKLFDF